MARIISQFGAHTHELKKYVGEAKQLVVDRDTFELYVMDGKTPGGHKVKGDVSAINSRLSTVNSEINAVQSRLSALEDGANGKIVEIKDVRNLSKMLASLEKDAFSAKSKADRVNGRVDVLASRVSVLETTGGGSSTDDGDGSSGSVNLPIAMSNVAGLVDKFSTLESRLGTIESKADVTELTKSVQERVLKSGDRGQLSGYEKTDRRNGSMIFVDKKSIDSIYAETSGTVSLSFTPAGASEVAVKTLTLKAAGTTTLSLMGAKWSNGAAPRWGEPGKILSLAAFFAGGKVFVNVVANER